MTCIVYVRDSYGVLHEYTAVAQESSHGRRLYELVEEHPRMEWGELNPAVQAVWERKARQFLEGSTL